MRMRLWRPIALLTPWKQLLSRLGGAPRCIQEHHAQPSSDIGFVQCPPFTFSFDGNVLCNLSGACEIASQFSWLGSFNLDFAVFLLGEASGVFPSGAPMFSNSGIHLALILFHSICWRFFMRFAAFTRTSSDRLPGQTQIERCTPGFLVEDAKSP